MSATCGSASGPSTKCWWLVPPHDAAALAAAIRETLEQKLQTQALCRAGQQFVTTRCSLDAMLDQLDAIYRQHLGEC